MADKFPFYRLNINEKLRKLMGLNYNYRILYFFVHKGTGYLSANMIPKNCKVHKIKLGFGHSYLQADIPKELIPYKPTGYALLNTNGFVIKLLK